jgi:uncharacterized protein YdcH (DUF465 family)
MTQLHDPVRETLVRDNAEYRLLLDQHRDYEARLMALVEKPVLTEDEQREESTLKKKKLQVKDRMEAIARSAREVGAHP